MSIYNPGRMPHKGFKLIFFIDQRLPTLIKLVNGMIL